MINELIPAVIQDSITGRVLMLGYMNDESIKLTKETGKVTFFSRSKNRLWTKGETSGNYLEFLGMDFDCDNDSILVQAVPHGPTCHTGSDTCFKEKNSGRIRFLVDIQNLIRDRIEKRPAGSYVTGLLEAGRNKIAQKVHEEAGEVIIEALNGTKERCIEESADLVFHLLVLLTEQGIDLDQVVQVLEQRNQIAKR